MKHLLLPILIFFSFPIWALSDSVSIIGYWLNEKEQVIVEVYILENELKGKVVWLGESLNELNEPRRDIMNRKPTLRSRLLIGTDIFYGFTYKKDVWKHGKVYNFRNGHTYNAKLKIDNEGNLQWTGYYGILVFLSKTKKWKRVTDYKTYNLD